MIIDDDNKTEVAAWTHYLKKKDQSELKIDT